MWMKILRDLFVEQESSSNISVNIPLSKQIKPLFICRRWDKDGGGGGRCRKTMVSGKWAEAHLAPVPLQVSERMDGKQPAAAR